MVITNLVYLLAPPPPTVSGENLIPQRYYNNVYRILSLKSLSNFTRKYVERNNFTGEC